MYLVVNKSSEIVTQVMLFARLELFLTRFRQSPTLSWRVRVISGELQHKLKLNLKLPLHSHSHSHSHTVCINPHTELIMAPHAGFDPDSIKQKARKDLLHLLEGVSKASPLLSRYRRLITGGVQLTAVQVRGKKNLILEKDLAGPIGLFVNFSTLQDYGVGKVFFLENGNADTSQRNVVFVARGEMARHARSIAGVYSLVNPLVLNLSPILGAFASLHGL
jgi:hypothetical protein